MSVTFIGGNLKFWNEWNTICFISIAMNANNVIRVVFHNLNSLPDLRKQIEKEKKSCVALCPMLQHFQTSLIEIDHQFPDFSNPPFRGKNSRKLSSMTSSVITKQSLSSSSSFFNVDNLELRLKVKNWRWLWVEDMACIEQSKKNSQSSYSCPAHRWAYVKHAFIWQKLNRPLSNAIPVSLWKPIFDHIPDKWHELHPILCA